MTIDLIIAIDQNINDPLTMGQSSIVSNIFNIASNIIEEGGKIIVQRQYDNANPDKLYTFETTEELADWKKKLNEMQVILNREEIT